MDLSGTRRHLTAELTHQRNPHVVVALLGQFKEATGEKYDFMPLVVKTASGLVMHDWFRRMVEWYEAEGKTAGPVFVIDTMEEQGLRNTNGLSCRKLVV